MSSSWARLELWPEKSAMLPRRASAKRAAGISIRVSRNSLQRDLPNSSCVVFLASKTPSVQRRQRSPGAMVISTVE